MKPRIKFDHQHLFENEKGIKLLYDNINNFNFKNSKSFGENLDNLMKIYKNWHFQLFPKNDFDLFTNKVVDLGGKKSGVVYKRN